MLTSFTSQRAPHDRGVAAVHQERRELHELVAANAMLPGDNYNAFSDRDARFLASDQGKALRSWIDSFWLEAGTRVDDPLAAYGDRIGKMDGVANAYPLAHAGACTKVSAPLIQRNASSFSAARRSRAFSAMVLRRAAGDMPSTADELAAQVPAALALRCRGCLIGTTDIGGWEGTDWTTPKTAIFSRVVLQFGAFCPIFRIHGIDVDRKLFSTNDWGTRLPAPTCSRRGQLRYRLMPTSIRMLAGDERWLHPHEAPR